MPVDLFDHEYRMKKGTGPICAKHPSGRWGELDPSLFFLLIVGLLVLPVLGCATLNLADYGGATADRALLPYLPCEDYAGQAMEPSNDRDWSPDQAVLSYAEFDGNLVTVHNIRNSQYRTTEDYTVRYYDKTFDLDKLDSVDFIVVPFPGFESLAHTMLSFGFAGKDYLCVSVEVRKEKGEQYAAFDGLMNQFEIMYVVADERDLIGLRTNYRMHDVHLYPTQAKPEQARALFMDVFGRVNKLARQPEFYNTLTNNCTTNIVRHVNRLWPDRVPTDYRSMLPGHTARLAYDLGLLDTDTSFERTRLAARVNEPAYVYRDSEEFSVKIRR